MASRSPDVSGSLVIRGSGGTGVLSGTGCGGAGVGGGGTLGAGGAGSGLATGGFFLPQAPAKTSRAITMAANRFCVITLSTPCPRFGFRLSAIGYRLSDFRYRDQFGNLLFPSRVSC